MEAVRPAETSGQVQDDPSFNSPTRASVEQTEKLKT